MKKLLISITIIGLLASCCNNKKPTVVPVDLTKYTAITEADVMKMQLHYAVLIKENPDMVIQQINMDGLLLEALLFNVSGLKLISAADERTNDITVIMQFCKNGHFSYYNIKDFFTPGLRGMRDQPPLCPPREGCETPLPESSDPEVLTTEKVNEMANLYPEMVRRDPNVAIQQTMMDGLLLQLFLYDVQGIKLIAAFDAKTNEVTTIVQFWRDGLFYYFDIKDLFTSTMRGMRGQNTLCPPPAACDLP